MKNPFVNPSSLLNHKYRLPKHVLLGAAIGGTGGYAAGEDWVDTVIGAGVGGLTGFLTAKNTQKTMDLLHDTAIALKQKQYPHELRMNYIDDESIRAVLSDIYNKAKSDYVTKVKQSVGESAIGSLPFFAANVVRKKVGDGKDTEK